MSLPGKALAVAILVWHLKSLGRNHIFRWEPHKAEAWGLSRHAVYRGLKSLERAGLIVVERRTGACPIVRVLVPPSTTRADQPGHEPGT